MRGTVSDHLIEQLMSRGIDTCFGVPGDYTLNFYNQLSKSKIKLVGTTNELCAGYAADAYARVKGIGLCCATYCVGGFSLVNAIACAFAEKSPVVFISGSPGLKEREQKVLLHHMVGHFECQHKVFEKITCANTVLRDPDTAGYEIDRVLNACQEYKQPVYIELPRDIVDKAIRYDVYSIGTPKDKKTDIQNLNETIEEVSQWINNAKKPVIWAGVEVARYGMSKKLMKFVETTNIPVATTILGKSVINERSPLSLGVYCESIATEELKQYMEESDCVIMLGVMMTDVNTGFLPLKYQKRNIVLATSQSIQVRNHSYEDVKFVDFCENLFKSKIDKRPLTKINSKPDSYFLPAEDKKITVKRLFEKIDSIVDDKMAIISDIGESLFGALDIVVNDHHFISPAFYTTMGFAVPGALGIKAARPDLRPLVIVGDGAFQMTGQEFSTLVRTKSNAIIIVLNNKGYGMERIMLDGPFNDIQNWEYDKFPLVVGGGLGHKVETEEELDQAFKIALDSNQPNIINVILSQKDHSPASVRMLNKLAKKC